MRKEIFSQLHPGHQGIEKTRMLARYTLYWPNINDDIEDTVISLCQEHEDGNKEESLMPTEVSSGPRNLLATDIFEIKGDNFVIISDYFSKYPIFREMVYPVTSTSVTKV